MKEFYHELEWAPLSEKEEHLNRKLQAIVRFAYDNTPAIRARFEEAGIDASGVHTIRDLESLRPITRDELIKAQHLNAPFGGFCPYPPGKLPLMGVHPGPQFEPQIGGQEARVHVARILYRIGFRLGHVVVVTLSYHLVPAGQLLEQGLRHLRAAVVATGPGNTDLQVEAMRYLGVTGYVGFPRFFWSIIKRAEERGFRFPQDFALHKAIWIGERAPAIREAIEREYGIETGEVYGFAPLGLVSFECPEKQGMHIDEDFMVEIVDPVTRKVLGPGEIGEILVTPLNNRYFPLLRFGTGDLSFYTDEPCPCGRSGIRLVRIVGRVGEAVKTRGMFIHPDDVEVLASYFAEIAACQVIVTRRSIRDEIEGKLELKHEGAKSAALAEAFKERFRDRCRLKMDRVEFVPRGTISEGAQKVIDAREWEWGGR